MAEAESLLRQLEDDFVIVAARYSAPEFQSSRSYWMTELLKVQGPYSVAMLPRIALQYARLATTLEPKNATAHNNVAWALARDA